MGFCELCARYNISLESFTSGANHCFEEVDFTTDYGPTDDQQLQKECDLCGMILEMIENIRLVESLSGTT